MRNLYDDSVTARAFYVPAHRFAILSGLVHLIVCAVMAGFTSTWPMVLAVGVPAFAIPSALALLYPAALMARLAMATGFMMLTGLIIQQSGGDLEAHFSFFVMLSILVVYCDWRPIGVATVMILLHHLVFNLLQSARLDYFVWNDHRNGWGHLAVHVFVGALQAGALIYLSTMLRQRMVLQMQNLALGRSLKTLSEEASRDALTGLYNRRHLNWLIDEVAEEVAHELQSVVLLIADIDCFKAINDRHGHPAGDLVLKASAKTIQSCMTLKDCAIRQGGEEFIVILRGRSQSEGLDLAEVIRRRVAAAAVKTPEGEIKVTISIGVAAWRQEESFHDCYARADRALYRAKSHGRNRVAGETYERAGPIKIAL